ncbi:MAG: T9SS type A sorting domain-containing protein [Crocinitomicaceae bacterium]
MKNLLVAFLISFICSFQANATRTLYVDDFLNILGNTAAEDALLSYSQANEIEILLLYELHLVNATYDITHYSTSGILADFISKAKNDFGILKIGAVGENADFFWNVIHPYNASRSSSDERIEIINLEFEFWIQSATDPGGYYCDTYLTPAGYPCTNDGAYGFALSQLLSMDQLKGYSSYPLSTEIYVGWPTLSQSYQLAGAVDRMLVHAYVDDPNIAYDYIEDRIIDISGGGNNLDVSIIFSSEPNFMQNWLNANSMLAAETIFYNDWLNGASSWATLSTMNLEGFTYFAYTFNQNITVGTESMDLPEDITVAPNPVNDVMTITSDSQIELIQVYDQLGKCVLKTSNNSIDMSQLSKGLYTVHAQTDQRIEVHKIVKN